MKTASNAFKIAVLSGECGLIEMSPYHHEDKLARVLTNKAGALAEMKNFNEALSAMQEAVQIFREVRRLRGELGGELSVALENLLVYAAVSNNSDMVIEATNIALDTLTNHFFFLTDADRNVGSFAIYSAAKAMSERWGKADGLDIFRQFFTRYEGFVSKVVASAKVGGSDIVRQIYEFAGTFTEYPDKCKDWHDLTADDLVKSDHFHVIEFYQAIRSRGLFDYSDVVRKSPV